MRKGLENEVFDSHFKPILGSGESGIRTPEGLASLTVFKTAAFNRSANSPLTQIFSTNLSGKYSHTCCFCKLILAILIFNLLGF